jgi:hypothetical protein
MEVMMRKILFSFAALLCMAALALAAPGQASLGVSVTDGRLRAFYFSIGSYYHVPGADVLRIRDRYRLRDEELPVVFFLAARAHVAPSVIMGLRVRGLHWLDIVFRYNLTPDIFYVPVSVGRIGPPYGNAYGYFRKYRARREWRRIALSDREVIDLVNLRFISESRRIPPETVMEMRGRGEGFVVINDEIGKGKGQSGNGHEGQPGKDKDKGNRRR